MWCMIVLWFYSFTAEKKFNELLEIKIYNFKNLNSNINIFHVFLTLETPFMKSYFLRWGNTYLKFNNSSSLISVSARDIKFNACNFKTAFAISQNNDNLLLFFKIVQVGMPGY